MEKFLKLKISVQIRVGIITVVLFAIIISVALLIVSTLIQYNSMINYYDEIIEDEDNKMLLNFEQYIHTIETLLDINSKTDLSFYSILENTFYEKLEGLELNLLLNVNFESDKVFNMKSLQEKNDSCFNSGNLDCIVYKFYPDTSNFTKQEDFNQLLIYYNLIFPLLNSSLQEKCIGTYILKQYNNLQFYKSFYDKETEDVIGRVIFYAGTNNTPFDFDYNDTQYINNNINSILDHLIDLLYLIPTFNKKISLIDIFSNFNEQYSSIPLITSKYLFEGENDNPYKRANNTKSKINIYENNLSFESKIYKFNPISSDYINYILTILKNISDENQSFSDAGKDFANFLFKQLKSLTVFKWTDDIFENLIAVVFEKYKSSLNLLNSFYITKCEIDFDDDFNQYLKKIPSQIDIYDRRKIKVELVKYNIKYIYFNLSNDGEYFKQEYSLYYNKEHEKNKEMAKYFQSYKIYQGMYPTDTLNSFIKIFYNNFVTVNFYFSNLFSSFYDIDKIQKMCNIFFYQVLYPNLFLWAAVLVIIVIIVFKISDSISDPIDKLIQSVSMNNKSSKELNKYLKNISYEDDSTINDLFVLCKKLIIGGFKRENDEDAQQKKKIKKINAYNNISLVKTNNMIINESEILKGEKKQEINYFEKNSINKEKQFLRLNSNSSTNKLEKKFNFKVLSGPLFTGKFYQYNKGYLIKDKEYFDILTNEVNVKKKKYNDEKNIKNNKNYNNRTSIKEQ